MIRIDKNLPQPEVVTNFAFYKTFDNAIGAYTKEKREYVYNVHEGVSAGRFIKWLYEPHIFDEVIDDDKKAKTEKAVSILDMLKSSTNCKNSGNEKEQKLDATSSYKDDDCDYKALPCAPNKNVNPQYWTMEDNINRLERLSSDIRTLHEENGYDLQRHIDKWARVLDERVKSIKGMECVPNLRYQSLYDEALAMAVTLQKIEMELKNCARCKGDGSNGSYSTDDLLKNLCEIMYASEGYHENEKYKKINKEDIIIAKGIADG